MSKTLWKITILTILVSFGLFFIGCDVSPEAAFTVTYHGNGNTYGFPPVDNNKYTSGMEAIVLDKGSLLKEGYTFQNWNTHAQGTGETYTSADKIKITSKNVILFAIWTEL